MNKYSETINLNLYRVFYYVAKEQNINKAAKKLYISQPAVSKSLKKLEEILQIKLFDRNSNGVTLTDAGEKILVFVEKAYQEIVKLDEVISQIK